MTSTSGSFLRCKSSSVVSHRCPNAKRSFQRKTYLPLLVINVGNSGILRRKIGSKAIQVRAVGEGPAAVPGQGLSPELRSAIDTFISENKIVLFMKGTREMPLCGFSNTVIQILNTMNAPYVTVNILEDDLLRNGMKEYSSWPTFPQVYVDGEFYGGCDIMIAAYQNGELAEVLEAVLNS